MLKNDCKVTKINLNIGHKRKKSSNFAPKILHIVRYFIYLSYDGTRYHGWQIQPNGISVEGEIERCLSTILRQPIDIVGAGRTDAGVHARMMAAHFDILAKDAEKDVTADAQEESVTAEAGEAKEPETLDCAQLAYKLNRMLPRDISIAKIEPVSDEMHARFSAVRRTYHYYVHLNKNPFERHYSWECHFTLDFNKMNEAAKLLLEYEDFACFCKSHTDVKTTFCKVTESRWIEREDGTWYYRVTANRFLRNMVRAIVGTLVEVGRGRMSIDDFRKVIEGKKRTQAGESMPGNALFLEDIGY